MLHISYAMQILLNKQLFHSGGHFNPAVTLAVMLSGKIWIVDAACYMVAQLAGGFVGSMICRVSISQISNFELQNSVMIRSQTQAVSLNRFNILDKLVVRVIAGNIGQAQGNRLQVDRRTK